ncbi:unnamed protein product, partial [Mesorhabditis spiculigera]
MQTKTSSSRFFPIFQLWSPSKEKDAEAASSTTEKPSSTSSIASSTIPEKSSPTTKRRFRHDVAVLRALAIIAVLGYHFAPKYFPLGFYGVDLFFVISGYLIMGILASDRSPYYMKIYNFYYKRLRRICPLYYFVLLAIGFSSIFIYSAGWLTRFLGHFRQALMMYLNVDLLFSDGDYFAEATEAMPFLHAWSLAVEMQFYLVAPAIYFMASVRCSKLGPLGRYALAVLLFSSLIFDYLVNAAYSFYFPFSRLWQFAAGMLACALSKGDGEDSKASTKIELISVFTVPFLCTVFLPWRQLIVFAKEAKIVVTLAAAAFLGTASYGSAIDWSRARLGYIAAISYALYLIHYPVLRYAEYLQPYFFPGTSVFLVALPLSLLLSIIIHEVFEKPQLRAAPIDTAKNILLPLIVGLLFAQFWQNAAHPFQPEDSNTNIRNTETKYKLEGGHYVDDGFLDGHWVPPPFGHYEWLNNTGNVSVVVVGNSWASQQAHIVRELLPENVTSSMDAFTFPSRGVIWHYLKGGTEIFWRFMEKKRPKIVFIVQRYVDVLGDLDAFRPGNDTLLEKYMDSIDRLSKFADHIFILGHQPFDCSDATHDFLNRFVDHLNFGKNVDIFNEPYDITQFDAISARQRLRAVLERCQKCHLIDPAIPFIDENAHLIRTFDPATRLAYRDNGCHLTHTGIDLITSVYRRVMSAFLLMAALMIVHTMLVLIAVTDPGVRYAARRRFARLVQRDT